MKRNISAIILCAGSGKRLFDEHPKPKVMLRFGGKTLIERHIQLLSGIGIDDILLVTGYMAEDLEQYVRDCADEIPIRFVRNPRHLEGSVVSCAAAADLLRAGATVLLMDGDVLYDRRMLSRLLGGESENILLFDHGIEAGDEPVKICLAEDGQIVDFRKVPTNAHIDRGESVGFFRFSPNAAATLADRVEAYAAGMGATSEYEEAIRDMILAEPDRFGIVDITDLPWTEIDFPEDVIRARDEIFPLLDA